MRQATKTIACAVTGLMLLAGCTLARAQEAPDGQQPGPWVHVRVSHADEGETLALNLPLSALEVALRLVPRHLAENGRFRLEDVGQDVSLADLREIWAQVEGAGDADLITVDHEAHRIRVGRRGSQIQVRVREGRDGEQVTIDLPVRVVEALLAGDGDELNIDAAMAELRTVRGDVVDIRRDGDRRMRVWIDETAS
jgi:hypothetical protein